MRASRSVDIRNGPPRVASARPPRAASAPSWTFIYIFFTNGIPFDSPNRSEPCPGC